MRTIPIQQVQSNLHGRHLSWLDSEISVGWQFVLYRVNRCDSIFPGSQRRGCPPVESRLQYNPSFALGPSIHLPFRPNHHFSPQARLIVLGDIHQNLHFCGVLRMYDAPSKNRQNRNQRATPVSRHSLSFRHANLLFCGLSHRNQPPIWNDPASRTCTLFIWMKFESFKKPRLRPHNSDGRAFGASIHLPVSLWY
jgi:hypothetical protein